MQKSIFNRKLEYSVLNNDLKRGIPMEGYTTVDSALLQLSLLVVPIIVTQ